MTPIIKYLVTTKVESRHLIDTHEVCFSVLRNSNAVNDAIRYYVDECKEYEESDSYMTANVQLEAIFDDNLNSMLIAQSEFEGVMYD